MKHRDLYIPTGFTAAIALFGLQNVVRSASIEASAVLAGSAPTTALI
jgi:hypothetical protein